MTNDKLPALRLPVVPGKQKGLRQCDLFCRGSQIVRAALSPRALIGLQPSSCVNRLQPIGPYDNTLPTRPTNW